MAFFPIVIVEPVPAETDSFDRVRSSSPVNVFDTQLQYDNHPYLWEEVVTGSGSTLHDQDRACVELITANGVSGTVIRQSRTYNRYVPGTSQEVYVSGSHGEYEAGVVKRMGYFDDANGVYIMTDGDDVGNAFAVLRSSVSGSPVETIVQAADFNVDPLDGTGPSGVDLDPTTAQTYWVDIDWSAGQQVVVGVKFNGERVVAHRFEDQSTTSDAYMTTANLPMRYEMVSTGASAGKMFCIAASVLSTSIVDPGFEFSASNGSTTRTASSGGELPLLSARPKALFNGIVNRTWLSPIEAVVLATGNMNAHVDLRVGGVLTGASFSDAATEFSASEFDISATAITGGVSVSQGSAASGSPAGAIPARLLIPLALNIAGAHPTTPLTDVVTVVASGIGGNAPVTASLRWKEVR